ncbi:MAG: hypothetical protein BM564_12670 [Bacteroidetes bacterium MedPE-SWsnd-G2]|nr:MAG: hypothetical protein BM564_12670 [Bacteroidetes bacterium MedPE-SWsnd-G2]
MCKILIVDDNSKNIQVLANILSDYDYDIDYALNGLEATAIAKEEDFDLILMDVMMPVMNGFEACETIKTLENYSDIPIIFITAKTDELSLAQGFESGGVDYITKPFNKIELLARIKTHLQLKESKSKLKCLNNTLEKKVEERTVELRLANKKLLKLDAAKSEFLRIISHEIRTPLNGIIGAIQLIDPDELTEDTKELVDILDESSNRLELFAFKALNISNLNTLGAKVLKLSNTNILDLTHKIIDQFETLAVERNVYIKFNHDVTRPELKVDAKLLELCFKYIIQNAIEYSTPYSETAIQLKQNSGNFEFNCTNIGEQFSESFDIKETKPFSGHDKGDGKLGLSLILCKKIIETHGGEIDAGNTNKGAYVNIKLPINDSKLLETALL